MTVTPGDIERARLEYKANVQQSVTDIIQLLSLQPNTSPAHKVEAYRDGVRIPVNFTSDRVLYVYCLPWARGWSIFTTPDTDDVYSFSWREVNLKWRSYQMPVYNPRDMNGPWHCTPQQITAALMWVVGRVGNHEKRRRAQLQRKGWTY
jgi:hypothetical protein